MERPTTVTVEFPLLIAINFISAVGTYRNGIEQSIDRGEADPTCIGEVLHLISRATIQALPFDASSEEFAKLQQEAFLASRK